jgi:hypothetical protein
MLDSILVIGFAVVLIFIAFYAGVLFSTLSSKGKGSQDFTELFMSICCLGTGGYKQVWKTVVHSVTMCVVTLILNHYLNIPVYTVLVIVTAVSMNIMAYALYSRCSAQYTSTSSFMTMVTKY